MDAAAAAIEDYHHLLREDAARLPETAARFDARLREAKLTFGGRMLCPFLRPALVSPKAYDEVRAACGHIAGAVRTLETRLGPALWDLVDLTPEERDLAAIEPGYRHSFPTARLDSFVTPSSFQFVELNAETPAGIAYDDVLAELFLELPVVQRLRERYRLERPRAREALLDTLLACHRESGRPGDPPTIAIVDYEEVPTRTEHHLFREFFESKGVPALVCDPRHLTYEGGRLRHEGRGVDIVYRRLLVNEFLERASELTALLQAARDGAVTIVNPFRCKPLHKKAIFAVLTDDAHQALLGDAERAAIAAHVPWTRRVKAEWTQHQGQRVDLPDFIRRNRERLVMKPNDEYGGKGVFIGWETSAAEWDAALAVALAAPFVVQERVEIGRQSFPEFGPDGLRFRDVIVDLDPFLFHGRVEGFLTRLSATALANVSSGGGQVPAFLVERT